MSGTQAGGIKARDKNIKDYGADFYQKIGSKGGSTKTDKPKGFAANRELARIAGAKGGSISKRGEWTEEERAAHRKAKGQVWDIA